ncbi:MAG: zf-HC2 domain-containing protein [Pyrinomonadaceae bacterium]
MNGNCLDIGTIQAFLDGETRPEEAVKISDHVAVCDACTLMLAQAEEESSMVYSVLDRELNTLVPTQRLWTRINDSIAEEKSRTSVWQRLAAFVSTSFLSPSFAGAAGILMVVGLAVVVWNINTNNETTVASSETPKVVAPIAQPESGVATVSDPQFSSNSTPKVQFTKHSPEQINRIVKTDYRVSGGAAPRVERARYLPGEESYIKTINDLEQSVTAQNASLSASSQVSYAKDIAVVDDSIKKMREVVKKNPRNQAARQVLYSTYQDKIDLLKASSGRGEMMASLQY